LADQASQSLEMAQFTSILFLFALLGEAQGLLHDCKPEILRQADGLNLIRGRLFDKEGRYHGQPNTVYVGGGHPYMLKLNYTHYCQIPREQGVAWARRFQGGETREYIRKYWGPPNASTSWYDLWWTSPNGNAQASYGEDGYLDRITVSGAYRKTFRGDRLNDMDNFGWAPELRVAPVKEKAPVTPVVDAASAETAARVSAVGAAVTPEDAQKIAVGATRDHVVATLGKSYQRSAILSEKGEMETLVYTLSDGSSFQVDLLKGVVTSAKKL
jgi:hypothetical protein